MAWEDLGDLMKKLLTVSLTAVLAVFVLSGATTLLPKVASAAEDTKQKTTTTKPTTTTAEKTFAYIAQPNDTYSQMTRKAIQAYSTTNKIKLSNAKIIAAETNLTIQAGSPQLLIGQKVVIKESVVKDWVTKAQKMTPAQEAAWNVYTLGVNFNTSAVGQAK